MGAFGRGITLVAAGWMGCSADAPAPVSAPAGPQPTTNLPDLPAPVLSLPAAAQARLPALMARFKGVCDAEALDELRAMRTQYGATLELQQPLLLAFKTCEATDGLAELLAETLPQEPTERQRLELGAAWLRAARYPEAVEVLLPLAREIEPEQGRDTKAAWLAGFALFHGGRTDEALPWLEGGRGKSGNATDAPLLVGLSLLHAGEVDRAVKELEAGTAAAPGNRSLLAALARAYSAAGRTADAANASGQVRASSDAAASVERTQIQLAALAAALRAARTAGRSDDADKILDKMLVLAPANMKAKLLTARVQLYDGAGRTQDAATVRAQIAALGDIP